METVGCECCPKDVERPATQDDGRQLTNSALFIQCTNAGHYPPILNAAALLADEGWRVTILSSPSADTESLKPDEHRGVTYLNTPLRKQNAIRPLEYLRYSLESIRQARRLRPGLIYASDPVSALPALLAAQISGADVIYHEHDSPNPGSLRPWLQKMRSAAANMARLVVFPNARRWTLARRDLGVPADRARIVWNVPRRSELPKIASIPASPLIVYYHGSITPDRLPETVVEAVLQMHGRVQLRFAGYEAPGAPGYVARLLRHESELIQYLGQVPRIDLLEGAASAHVGLALMPKDTGDVNMRHMAGASNKPFDYMAAGLALLVSDLRDWRDLFVEGGFARACDTHDVNSVVAALTWFIEHPEERRAMAARGRKKIETEWNYETAFRPVIDAIEERRSAKTSAPA